MSILTRLVPIFAALLGGLAILAGCGEAPAMPAEGAVEAEKVGDRFSVYALDTESWWDQTGEMRALGSLEGRVQVLAMVYTHCAHTCPRIVADMLQLEAMTEELGKEVGFVLVSIDPDRDQPGRLASFAEGIGLDPARWTLLQGTDDGTRALAALLGVRYRQEADREIAHTNELTVLSPAGEIVHQRKGLDEPLEHTLDALVAAADTPPGSDPARR